MITAVWSLAQTDRYKDYVTHRLDTTAGAAQTCTVYFEPLHSGTITIALNSHVAFKCIYCYMYITVAFAECSHFCISTAKCPVCGHLNMLTCFASQHSSCCLGCSDPSGPSNTMNRKQHENPEHHFAARGCRTATRTEHSAQNERFDAVEFHIRC